MPLICVGAQGDENNHLENGVWRDKSITAFRGDRRVCTTKSRSAAKGPRQPAEQTEWVSSSRSSANSQGSLDILKSSSKSSIHIPARRSERSRPESKTMGWHFSSGCQHSEWIVGGCLAYDADRASLRSGVCQSDAASYRRTNVKSPIPGTPRDYAAAAALTSPLMTYSSRRIRL